jgi:carbohydrate kinase (thermoresistant glucokinase family)
MQPTLIAREPRIVVVMGVSGSGKTTIGQRLAERLGWAFQEGDSLHPDANIAKMKAGHALTDADRQPWLEALAAWIGRQLEADAPGVITCSLLKQAYRRQVIGTHAHVRLVFLHADFQLIADRLSQRHGHFMPPSLLQSQFDTLEPPGPGEAPLTVDIGQPADEIVTTILRQLGV